jgi:hypothetical protein
MYCLVYAIERLPEGRLLLYAQGAGVTAFDLSHRVLFYSLRFKVQGSKFKVQGSKFKVQSSRFKVQGSRFKGKLWVNAKGFIKPLFAASRSASLLNESNGRDRKGKR